MRAFIHRSCNQTLGNAKDDPWVLRRQANYIERENAFDALLLKVRSGRMGHELRQLIEGMEPDALAEQAFEMYDEEWLGRS